MATLNDGRARHSLVDYDRQRRQYSYPTVIITAANHDAKKTEHDAFIAAVADVTLGNLDFEEFVADREEIRPLISATSTAAQVSIEWIVTDVDDVTGAIRNVRIPTADITDALLLAAGSNLWDPTETQWTTFVTAFEAYVLSEDGNACSVSQVAFLQ